MSEKELLVRVLAITVLSFVLLKTNGSESPAVRTVRRRHVGDVYSDVDNRRICQDANNLTYLVDEEQCVRNEELLSYRGCRFSVAPIEELSNITLTIRAISDHPENSELITATTSNPLLQESNAVLVHSETQTLVVSPTCHIASLEVYRGRDQAIMISHDGFSLSDNGTLEIIGTSLAYSFEEYIGELYRMNLSCSGGGLPESGCLFFKVIGDANITTPKFENSVPGTVIGISDRVPDGVSSTAPITSLITTDPSRIGASDSESAPSNGPDLFIYIVAAATGIVALLFVIVLLCMVLAYCYSMDKKRNHRQAVTVATNLWFEQRDLIVLNNPPGPRYDANTLETVQ